MRCLPSISEEISCCFSLGCLREFSSNVPRARVVSTVLEYMVSLDRHKAYPRCPRSTVSLTAFLDLISDFVPGVFLMKCFEISGPAGCSGALREGEQQRAGPRYRPDTDAGGSPLPLPLNQRYFSRLAPSFVCLIFSGLTRVMNGKPRDSFRATVVQYADWSANVGIMSYAVSSPCLPNCRQ